MKTRCPTCKTRYDISPKALLEADGVARCFRCGTVFDAVAEDATAPGMTYSTPVDRVTALEEQAAHPAEDDTAAAEPGGDQSQETEHAPESAGPILGLEQPSSGQTESLPADNASEPLDNPRATPKTESEAAQPAPLVKADTRGEPQEPSATQPALDPQADNKAAPLLVADLQPDSRLLGAEEEPLPFEVPDNLEPLQPSPDVALDINDALYEKRSRRGFFYGLVTVLLVVGLGLQLAWQHRMDLLRQYPLLEPLCEYLPCVPKVVDAPDKISVLQRDVKPTANQPGSLTLSATIRNDATIAQHLPDIQLSLLDNNGALLIRRRLMPSDYLFPPPRKDRVMAPGEVVTIALDFEDPGHQASGFILDFL